MPSNVTSRGASREFVIRVLQNSLDWCKTKFNNGERISMPFPKLAVQHWIDAAREQSGKDPAVFKELGGTIFDPNDPSTHWRTSAQFFTWFKNNVERRSKFEALVNDSRVPIEDDVIPNSSVLQRAQYCQCVVALTTEIKGYLRRRNSSTTSNSRRYIQPGNITPDGVNLLNSPLLPDEGEDQLFSSADDFDTVTANRNYEADVLFRPIEPDVNSEWLELEVGVEDSDIETEEDRNEPEDEDDDNNDDDELTAMELMLNEPIPILSTFDNLGVEFDEVITLIDSFGSSHDDFVSLSSSSPKIVKNVSRPWKSESELDLLDVFSDGVDTLDYEFYHNTKKRSRV